jgi:hypothetical protein
MRSRIARVTALATLAGLPGAALAGAIAHAAKSLAPPRAGTWTMVPTATNPGLLSGRFTVKGMSVTHLQAKAAKTTECAGGALKVSGSVAIVEAALAHGHHQWEVASGGNAVGGGSLQPTPVSLTVAGQREVNATMTIAFPTKGEKSTGEIGWGDDGTGFQTCAVAFTVKQG